MIEVVFNDFINSEWGIDTFNKVRFNVFYVIMKRGPIENSSKSFD